MKRFYFIFVFPVLLLLVFSAVYWRFSVSSDEAERVAKEKLAQTRLIDEQKKKEEEAKARLDSEKRVADRLAEEKKKEAERIARWETESKRILGEGAQYASQVASYTKEAGELTALLAELRQAKETRTRELLASATEAETAAIAKRSAELEIQRLTEMVARKVAASAITKR